jgi:signal transduction histidine kinase
MATREDRDPRERNLTDEGLRSERDKTDAELELRSAQLREAATDLVEEARLKADSVLSDARDVEDLKRVPAQAVVNERAREDAALESSRDGADAVVRDAHTRRRLALASLLASEREDTDLRLEIERMRSDQDLTSRENFMAMVSHDLRSLLGGIALSAELLKGVEDSEEPFVRVKHYASTIQRFSARMSRLVGDLIDIASIEAGHLSLIRARRHASLLLRDSLEAFGPAAAAQGITLVCESETDPGVIDVDHDRILQVLTNLVGNALKFTPREGRIVIRAERRDNQVCFAVADTGQGISPDLLDKIFERNFQAGGRDPRGLGLGLFIARSIIGGHGGTIWAESTLGRGTTIFFTVPISPE